MLILNFIIILYWQKSKKSERIPSLNRITNWKIPDNYSVDKVSLEHNGRIIAHSLLKILRRFSPKYILQMGFDRNAHFGTFFKVKRKQRDFSIRLVAKKAAYKCFLARLLPTSKPLHYNVPSLFEWKGNIHSSLQTWWCNNMGYLSSKLLSLPFFHNFLPVVYCIKIEYLCTLLIF